MRTSQLRYEPDRRLPYGYWSCDTCGANFSGGGNALHARRMKGQPSRCPVADEGYDSCNYNFGPVEVSQVKLVGQSIGGLTFELYCAWLSEGHESPDLGDLDVEAMLRDEEGER